MKGVDMDFEREELFNEDTKNFKYLDDLIHSGKRNICLGSDIRLDDDEIKYGHSTV